MPNWRKLIISGSDASLKSLTATEGITGSLFGTASWAENATTASYVLTAVSASHAVTASYIEGGVGTPIYLYTQSSPSSTWLITHNLGTFFPIVTVYDITNNVIVPQEITSLSTSSLSITFPLSIAGYASIAGGNFSSISQGITQNETIINSLIFG
jgi:hypothetical protein